MHAGAEQATEATNQLPEDDMKEGDLGDGLGRKPGGLYDRRQGRRDLRPHLDPRKRAGGNGSVASWKSCRALYTTFHRELEAEQPHPSWRLSGAESLSDLSCEELKQKLQEVSEEVGLLRCELEATQRHLEGKYEALKILQNRAVFDKATTHTKTLLQKSDERNKALEKEVNALQWEINFNQVQFKNFERSWKEKYDRVCGENKALSNSVEDKLREVQELKSENSSLSQQCLELLSMLSAQEKKAFQGSLPPHSNLTRDGTALELAVLGACRCSSGVRAQCPCSCARTAAASRKQVLQLQQELELQRRRKEEAHTMADAFRIAFEQQLKRKSEHVMRLAEAEGYLRKDMPPTRREEAAVKGGSVSMAQKLKGMLQNSAEVKISDDPAEMLRNLLDLLNDKEEALAHQRKVSYMLARNSEDLECRLLQLRGQDCKMSSQGMGHKGWDSQGTDSPLPKPSKTQESPSINFEDPVPKPSETQGSSSTDLDSHSPKPSNGPESPSTDMHSPSLKPSETEESLSIDLDILVPKPSNIQESPFTDLDSPSPKSSDTQESPSTDSPALKPPKTQGCVGEDLDIQMQCPVTGMSSRETPSAAASKRQSRGRWWVRGSGATESRGGKTEV